MRTKKRVEKFLIKAKKSFLLAQYEPAKTLFYITWNNKLRITLNFKVPLFWFLAKNVDIKIPHTGDKASLD